MCSDPNFLESYTDAVVAIMEDQAVAGTDIMTDGFVRYDIPPGFAPGSSLAAWDTNGLAYVGGTRKVETRPEGLTVLGGIVGDENSNAFYKISAMSPNKSGYFWLIEEEPSPGKLGIWVETVKVALPHVKGAFKFSGPSAAMAAMHSFNRTGKNDRDVYFALHKAHNKILREIANAGCKIIQLDYPFSVTHWAAQFNEISKDVWNDLIEAFNEQVKGVDAHIWVHFCFGAPILYSSSSLPIKWHMAKVYPHISELKADCIQSEAANTDGRYLDLELKSWKEHLSEKDYAVGAVTPYDLTETYEDVNKIVAKALEYVPPEKLALTSDEGIAGNGFLTRRGATLKMKLLVEAAKNARHKLG
jgi:methionine synthase II (cobalamin-independent)